MVYMEKKGGFLDSWIGWLILGLITLAIAVAALGILGKAGSGGIGEIFRMLFNRG